MRSVFLAAVVAALCIAPSVASAAEPNATTGATARLTPTTVSLTGKVDPRGLSTSYHFQWGRTTTYGAVTPTTPVGAGTSAVNVIADIGGLTPNTVYHYRLVATNRDGTDTGGDRSFRTPRQPLGLSLVATPNPVTFGSGTTISGNLSGTGNAGETIVLRQNPFPFTGGLQPFGNPVVTDKAGNFAVALLSVPITTQYQASVQGKSVTSPVLTVPVAVRVSTEVSRRTVRRGSKLRFRGSIRPARPGAQVAIQKLNRKGRWVTVAGTVTRRRTSTLSAYGKTIRPPRGGRYRVFVGLQDGNYTSGVGRTIAIRTYR